MSGILLPRIYSITLTGFGPLFEKTIELELPDGPFLIMGGNAMGKTTTLQAIAYAIAGSADEEIQEDKKDRWGPKYFRQRLNPDQESEVQVEFALGEWVLTVRRGTRTESLLGIKIGEDDWVHDSNEAQSIYDNFLEKICGISSTDFRFLVHRLCYLPESRQSLIWEQKAQTRVVMLTCSDFERESHYRQLSHELRELDTKKRHLHVDIGHIQEQIERNKLANKKKKPAEREGVGASRIIDQADEIYKLITQGSRRRLDLFQNVKAIRAELTDIDNKLESLQGRLSTSEDAFILKTLRGVETGSEAVALQKLLVYHRCPYCSQESEKLASSAAEALSNGNCPICGQLHSIAEHDDKLDDLRKKVAELNLRRGQLELEYRNIQTEVESLTEKEREYRIKLDKISLQLPRVPKERDFDFDTKTESAAARTLKIYKARHAELEASWQQLKKQLDKVYSDFTAASSIRLRRLLEIASSYSEEFLGYPCEFIATPAKGELGELNYFVPKFDDHQRNNPQACSESERFFLDIAFRMALVELAGELSSSKSTFICETPENALDLAYSSNVAEMFRRFARRGFSILLTANVQIGGIAEPLLKPYPPANRTKRVFNLLREGNLSKLQKSKMSDFEDQMEKIIGR